MPLFFVTAQPSSIFFSSKPLYLTAMAASNLSSARFSFPLREAAVAIHPFAARYAMMGLCLTRVNKH